MGELLPCPFACKDDLIFTEQVDCSDGFAHGYTIFCPTCGITMSDEYKDDLVARWNTRLIPDEPELLEAAQMGVIWLTSALNCSLWVWDGDQREAAEIELSKMNAAIDKATRQ